MSLADNPEKPSEKPPLNPAWWLLIIALVQLGAPYLPVHSLAVAVVLTIAINLVYVGSVVGFGLGVARKQLSLPHALAWLALGALVWLAVQQLMVPKVEAFHLMRRQVGAIPTPVQLFTINFTETVQDLALIAGAMFAGTIVARMIRHPNLVGPIGVLVALIDVWGVLFSGPVSKLLQNEATQPIAAKAMAAGPKIGSATTASSHGPSFPIELPAVGVGDYLFIALLLSVLVNLGMNWRTPARIMWLACCAALLGITFLPVPALPGLLFIGLAAVIPNIQHFEFTREEKFALLYAGVFVVILTGGMYFGLISMLPSDRPMKVPN